MSQWTMADVKAVQARRDAATPPVARAKYGNKKTVVENIAFDSKKEADRYLFLKMRERLGEIDHLDVQPVLPINTISNAGVKKHSADYTADFRYYEHYCGRSVLHIEDVKSPASKTEAYRLRKQLVEDCHDIVIEEV
jgi:hypothetical protein